jgi:type I site-specific restriction endonuclease
MAGSLCRRVDGHPAKNKKADYLLRYTPDFTIAVVEAKVLTVANKGR